MNNLQLWNKFVSYKCFLCKNRDITQHILNGCKVALEKGRFTFRHDNMANYIVNKIDRAKFTVYSDIHGHKITNRGTIPATRTVTELKPDIVVIDDKKKTIDIFELTVPFEGNIAEINTLIANKYAYFAADIKTHSATVTAFEAGSRGYITRENEARLHKLC